MKKKTRGYYYCNEKEKHTLANDFKCRHLMINVQNLLVKHCKLPGNLCIRYRDLLYADKRQYETTMKRKVISVQQLLKEKINHHANINLLPWRP